MSYNVATIIDAFQEADGRARINIRYTGNQAEPPIDFPLYINQSEAISSDFIREQAMKQIATLNQNKSVATGMALPLVLDTTTPIPEPPAGPSIPTQRTYFAASPPFTPGATPQDVFTLTGSDSKTVTVLRTGITTLQTTAGVNTWHLVKRSTANSGGTSVVVPSVPAIKTLPAAAATVRQYTVNPTPGILVSRVWTGRIASPAPATAGIGDPNIVFPLQGLQLVGATDVLAWNFNGVALPAGLSVMAYVWWTEL